MSNIETIQADRRFDNIVFFDFDGTLIKVNSLFYFLIYYRKRPLILELFMFTVFLATNFIPIVYAIRSKNWRMNLKTALWRYASFDNESKMKKVMLNFFLDEIQYMVNPDIVEAVKKYNDSFDLFILSASPDYIIEAFSDAFYAIYNVRFFYKGSETSFDNLSKSINFSTNMRCTKKRAFGLKLLSEVSYKYSLAFGDSHSDLHILSICNGGFVGDSVAEKIIEMSKKY